MTALNSDDLQRIVAIQQSIQNAISNDAGTSCEYLRLHGRLAIHNDQDEHIGWLEMEDQGLCVLLRMFAESHSNCECAELKCAFWGYQHWCYEQYASVDTPANPG